MNHEFISPRGVSLQSLHGPNYDTGDFAGTAMLAEPGSRSPQLVVKEGSVLGREREGFIPEGRFQKIVHPYQPRGRRENPVRGPSGEVLIVDVEPQTLADGKQYVRIDQNGEPRYYPYLNGMFYSAEYDNWYRGVNGLVHDQSYYTYAEHPHTPTTVVTSFYRSLRRWERKANPEAYQKMVENFQAVPDREYRLLADPGEHIILPLLPSYEDKKMMIDRGLAGVEEDLGFRPKGMWLPECAVDMQTLEALVESGVKFTVLKSNQIGSTEQNPVWVKTPKGDIAIFHFDAEESGALAFDASRTQNADRFLQGVRDRIRGIPDVKKRKVAIAMDKETEGHHKQGVDKWGARTDDPDIMAQYGLAPFDMQGSVNAPESERVYTFVHENSSWSCWHGTERWTGGESCNCAGHESRSVKQEKQLLYQTLTTFNIVLAERLDQAPNWREVFVPFSIAMDEISESDGDIWEDVRELSKQPKMGLLQDASVAIAMMAEYYTLLGRTSCGWFFNNGGIEKEIPWFGIQVAENLIPELTDVRQQISSGIYRQAV